MSPDYPRGSLVYPDASLQKLDQAMLYKGCSDMKKIGILICVLLLTGCGDRWIRINTDLISNREEKRIDQDQVQYEKNYKIGERITAFVGQEIIRVKSFIEKREIFSPVDLKNVRSQEPLYIHAKYHMTNYHIRSIANIKYQIDRSIQVDNQRFNIIQLNDSDGNRWGILINDIGIVVNDTIYSFKHESLFFPSFISVSPIIFEISQNEDREIKTTIPGPTVELIYSGKNDISLNVTYREYTPDNLARTAFFQNITYQADAKQIRFKDFVIKIDDISNEKITYTVLEDGLK